MLRLDRLRALVDVYPGVEREDEMVAAFDYCLHGKGGAAPSIDTAMHGLVDAPHVDHLHPGLRHRAGHRRRRRGADQGMLRRPGRLGALAPPGFQLGLDIAAIQAAHPQAIGVILGGHGITAWGDDQRRVRGQLAARSSAPPPAFLAEHGKAEPFGAVVPGSSRCPRPSGARGPPRWPR